MIIPMSKEAQLQRSQEIIDHHNIELSIYEDEQRQVFTQCLSDVDDAWERYRLAKVAHEHTIGPRAPVDPDDKWFSTTAVCVVCHETFGWWCPKSESGRCRYSLDQGEMCIHCGHPEERK